MKLLSQNKMINVITSIACAFIFLVNPLVQASHCCSCAEHYHQTVTSRYIQQYPWLGLITPEITNGPLTISQVHLNKDNQLTVVKPGEIIHGTLQYKIDATNQEKFHRYHLVVGLTHVGSQDCATHTYGIWDGYGKGSFTLKAPLKPGIYEVRFSFQEGTTCEEARKVWDQGQGEPTSFTTIGAIIVE